MFTLGALTLAFAFIRMFIFKMPESPRYLLSKNRDAEAVEAVNYVARRNKKPEPLTLAMLQQIDLDLGIVINPEETGRQGLTRTQILKENLADFKSTNFKTLFATRKLAQHTTIIWLIWLTIGIAYPLYFNFLPTYLAQKFTDNSSFDETYRNYCIASTVGVVGPVAAAFAVRTKLGRRYMMGISAIITGVFLFSYTAARTPSANLAFTCISGLWGNFGKCSFLRCQAILSWNVLTLVSHRICNHVRLHPRELFGPSTWTWYGIRCDLVEIRWSLCKFDRHLLGFHGGSYLCLSWDVDGCGSYRLRASI